MCSVICIFFLRSKIFHNQKDPFKNIYGNFSSGQKGTMLKTPRKFIPQSISQSISMRGLYVVSESALDHGRLKALFPPFGSF